MGQKKQNIDIRLAGTRWYFYLNPMSYRMHRELKRALPQYASGKTLDLGAGRMAYRDTLKRFGKDVDYTSLDVEKNHDEISIVADVCQGTGLPSGSFDTVFCSWVLEHVDEPKVFLEEAHRLLRPGGHLILTAPFLFFLHGLPHDYYRYSPQGIRYLADKAGFEVLECRGVGGILLFLATLAAAAAFHFAGFLPVWMLTPLFACVAVSSFVDRILDTSGLTPASVLLIARKEA